MIGVPVASTTGTAGARLTFLLCVFGLMSVGRFDRAETECDCGNNGIQCTLGHEHGDTADLVSTRSSSLLQASPTRRKFGDAPPQPEDAMPRRASPLQATAPSGGPVSAAVIDANDDPTLSTISAAHHSAPREATMVTVIREDTAYLSASSSDAITKFITRTSQRLRDINWSEQGVTVPMSPVAVMALCSAMLGLASGVLMTRLCSTRGTDADMRHQVASAEVLQQWVSPSSAHSLKTYVRFHNGPLPPATGDDAEHAVRHTCDSSTSLSPEWQEAKPPTPPPPPAPPPPCDTQMAVRDVQASDTPNKP